MHRSPPAKVRWSVIWQSTHAVPSAGGGRAVLTDRATASGKYSGENTVGIVKTPTKSRFSLGLTPFLLARAKEMGCLASGPNDTAHTERRARTNVKRGNPRRGFPLDPLLRFNKHKRVPRSAERGGTYVRRRAKRISRRTPCIMSTSTPPQPLHSSRHSARAMAAALPPLRFISMCVYCPPCGYEKSPAGRALGV